MFEDLIKEMQRINGQSVSIPIELDEKGYVDKQCPSNVCEFIFKVNSVDWTNIVKDEAVWCPLCRHEAASDQWFTTEQIEHAKTEALEQVKGAFGNALKRGAKDFNRRQTRNGFISMSMEVKIGQNRTYIIPAKAAELMQLEIQCESCNSRFAVIGSAYFCPACGHNSVAQTFADSLRKVSVKIKKDNIDVVRSALIESVGKDDAELTCRSLIESCIGDGVTAFQRYCERMYEPFGAAPFNAFQRLEQGSKLWKEAVNQGYDDWLTNNEISALKVLYQKRHLLSHSDGIVDSQYIEKSGDSSYKVGQRIVVRSMDVDSFVSILEKLSAGIKKSIENKLTKASDV